MASVPGLAVPGKAIPGDLTPGYPGSPARYIQITLGQPYTIWEAGDPHTSWTLGEPYA